MVLVSDSLHASSPKGQKESGGVLVVRGWGRDGPGIAEALTRAAVEHNCKVLDISQFLLEGALMLTLALQVSDTSSMQVMKDLQQCAKDRKIQLEFHFPDTSMVEKTKNENVALLSVVSTVPLTPKLLHDLDAVLAEHGCVLLDIDHRNDNKKEFNGEYSKLQMRVACPPTLKLANLYMGVDEKVGLQEAAQKHGAEVTVRWWDAMNRPNGKSLVVFGLSHVLCPYDVLDEVLREAGLDPESVPETDGIMQQNQKKVEMLKGKSADAIQRVIARLQYTPGVQTVCSALKRMGFRLAVLTNTGVREIADQVKRQLGVDYVICRDIEVEDGRFTGNYVGELTDISFRKSDLLKLLAEREDISYRNVIVVGEFLQGLKPSNAKLVLETFGPHVVFNATKHRDLSIVLYLLGFNGSDVQSLRKRKFSDGPGANGDASTQDSSKKHLVMQVSSKTRQPGQICQIFEPLKKMDSGVDIVTIRQCSLQDGGMCLGVDLDVTADADQVAKELLFSCQKQGLQIMQVGEQSRVFTSAGPFWRSLPRRHVLTLVQQPHISGDSLQAMLAFLAAKSVNVIRMDRLSVQEFAAMQFTVSLPEELDSSAFAKELVAMSQQHGADIAVQRDDVERSMRRLVVFDMDSTLIQQEVIDELAKIAGVEEKVKAITEAAMQGQIDFFESLKQRVALLKGHNAEELFSKVKANLIYTPGAKKLCTTLKSLGFKMAVISGGFLPVAQEVKRYLGLDYAFANTLEVEEHTGLLTGNTSGPVVTPQRKRTLLATIANVEGCEVQQTIAVGDGANDIPMLNTAGLGIAFCAKPKVQAVAEFRINQKDLSTVLFLIGVSEHAAERLRAEQVA